MDFLVATAFIAAFVLLSWLYGRTLGGGGPLNAFKRRLLIYASVFGAGMIYLMMVAAYLRWRDQLMFVLIAIWGLSLAFIAWWRYRGRAKKSATQF